jgi:SPP1 family predicted phage head-tail adaptor
VTAGRHDQLITIERATTTQDDYGDEVPTWAEYAREWAAVFYGRGDERRQAAMEQGQQAATFQVLANLDTLSVTLKDRITLAGFQWDIQGISPDTPRRGLVELTATRAL